VANFNPNACVQVLEEMMDNGYPLSTENNVLKELVHPPSGIKNAMKAIGVANKSKCVWHAAREGYECASILSAGVLGTGNAVELQRESGREAGWGMQTSKIGQHE
jgi:hypothetical protein